MRLYGAKVMYLQCEAEYFEIIKNYSKQIFVEINLS